MRARKAVLVGGTALLLTSAGLADDSGDGERPALMCTAEASQGGADGGEAVAEPAPAFAEACPEPEVTRFDVRIAVDARDRARVKGLGSQPTRMSLLELRSTSALADRRVVIDASRVTADDAARLCRALRKRDVAAFRAPDWKINQARQVAAVTPRDAYRLTRFGAVWINVAEAEISVDGVDAPLQRVPYARYGEGAFEQVLAKLLEAAPDGMPAVLIDIDGEHAEALAKRSLTHLERPVYYVEGGHTAWSEWQAFHRRIVQGRKRGQQVTPCSAG
jgi:hypothetical protein